jgi:hypothetical protein
VRRALLAHLARNLAKPHEQGSIRLSPVAHINEREIAIALIQELKVMKLASG